jgi:hypothetical protein
VRNTLGLNRELAWVKLGLAQQQRAALASFRIRCGWVWHLWLLYPFFPDALSQDNLLNAFTIKSQKKKFFAAAPIKQLSLSTFALVNGGYLHQHLITHHMPVPII